MNNIIAQKKVEEILSKIDLDINLIDYVKIEIKSAASNTEMYLKDFDEPQLGLFMSVEISKFSDGSKNIFLRSDISDTNYTNLKDFVNDLVTTLGNDYCGSSFLDEDEIDMIMIENYWLGRTWDRFSPVIAIDGLDSENFTLSILGLKK